MPSKLGRRAFGRTASTRAQAADGLSEDIAQDTEEGLPEGSILMTQGGSTYLIAQPPPPPPPASAAVDQALLASFDTATSSFWETLAEKINTRLGQQDCTPASVRQVAFEMINNEGDTDLTYSYLETLFGHMRVTSPSKWRPQLDDDQTYTTFSKMLDEECDAVWKLVAEDVKQQTGEVWTDDQLMQRYGNILWESRPKPSAVVDQMLTANLSQAKSMFWQTLLRLAREKMPEQDFTINSLRTALFDSVEKEDNTDVTEEFLEPETALLWVENSRRWSTYGMPLHGESQLVDLYIGQPQEIWDSVLDEVKQRTGEHWRLPQLVQRYEEITSSAAESGPG